MVEDIYVETAIEASKHASSVLRENRDNGYQIEYKTPDDIVSTVDLSADAAIREYISDRHPEHAFFTEEYGSDGESSYQWIIDPLDGTHNYINGFPQYCVTIALEHDGDLLAGVVRDVSRSDQYLAVRNEGAWLNERPLTVSTSETVRESFLGIGISPPTATDERFLDTFRTLIADGRTQGVRRVGAGGIDTSFVARGIFDGFLDKYTSPWDVAAASLLVTEAGGMVTDYQGDPVDFSVGERDVNIVASNGRIHEELLEIYESTAA